MIKLRKVQKDGKFYAGWNNFLLKQFDNENELDLWLDKLGENINELIELVFLICITFDSIKELQKLKNNDKE